MSTLFTSELTVKLIDGMGSDDAIIRAARVSTGNDEEELSPEKRAGLINYLAKKRHGSPFEHTAFTFYVEAPIFVFREFMRHRIASYNETSARYRKMDPKFYIYPADRPLVQEGSGAHPKLVTGSEELTTLVEEEIRAVGEFAWIAYDRMLEAGAANEVARAVLPVNLYSSMYVTVNARALMNFLSLRIDDEGNTFETKPQWEIQKVAEQMEAIFKQHFPITWDAWNRNGRVAP